MEKRCSVNSARMLRVEMNRKSIGNGDQYLIRNISVPDYGVSADWNREDKIGTHSAVDVV